jgi:hypothetical protein
MGAGKKRKNPLDEWGGDQYFAPSREDGFVLAGHAQSLGTASVRAGMRAV